MPLKLELVCDNGEPVDQHNLIIVDPRQLFIDNTGKTIVQYKFPQDFLSTKEDRRFQVVFTPDINQDAKLAEIGNAESSWLLHRSKRNDSTKVKPGDRGDYRHKNSKLEHKSANGAGGGGGGGGGGPKKPVGRPPKKRPEMYDDDDDVMDQDQGQDIYTKHYDGGSTSMRVLGRVGLDDASSGAYPYPTSNPYASYSSSSSSSSLSSSSFSSSLPNKKNRTLQSGSGVQVTFSNSLSYSTSAGMGPYMPESYVEAVDNVLKWAGMVLDGTDTIRWQPLGHCSSTNPSFPLYNISDPAETLDSIRSEYRERVKASLEFLRQTALSRSSSDDSSPDYIPSSGVTANLIMSEPLYAGANLAQPIGGTSVDLSKCHSMPLERAFSCSVPDISEHDYLRVPLSRENSLDTLVAAAVATREGDLGGVEPLLHSSKSLKPKYR